MIIPILKLFGKLNRGCDRVESKMAASSATEEEKGKVTWPNVRSAYELGDVIGKSFDNDIVL